MVVARRGREVMERFVVVVVVVVLWEGVVERRVGRRWVRSSMRRVAAAPAEQERAGGGIVGFWVGGDGNWLVWSCLELSVATGSLVVSVVVRCDLELPKNPKRGRVPGRRESSASPLGGLR